MGGEGAVKRGAIAFGLDLREFGGAGLPFAVVLDGNGQPVKRLPDLFMADTLASTLHNATEE